MKIYTHPNLYQVVNVQNLLAMHDIQCRLTQEFLGAGAGELAPQDVWPELWLLDERDKDKAQSLVDSVNQEEGEDWFCSQCGERNASSFELCWSCHHEHEVA